VITSHSKGFFNNDSIEGDTFSPEVSSKDAGACHSHSLVGLIYQLSPRFRTTLEEHINNVLGTEPLLLTRPNMSKINWLSPFDSARTDTSIFKAP
jgi:hypothetical protein